jgi:hypothetical protein
MQQIRTLKVDLTQQKRRLQAINYLDISILANGSYTWRETAVSEGEGMNPGKSSPNNIEENQFYSWPN